MAEERQDDSATDAVSVGDTELLTFQYLKRRPMHPDRFLKFARRFFGPLGQDRAPDADAPPPPPLPFPICQALVAASGCLWFIGSDDLRGEWLAEVSGSRHVLRCGAAWPASSEDGASAGERRVELALSLRRPHADVEAVEAAVRRELDLCLITRAEAAALEAGDASLEITAEWETIRANHAELSSWADQWLPALLLLRLSTRIVGSLPGSAAVASAGQPVVRCLRRFLRVGSCAPTQGGTSGDDAEAEDDDCCCSPDRDPTAAATTTTAAAI